MGVSVIDSVSVPLSVLMLRVLESSVKLPLKMLLLGWVCGSYQVVTIWY